MGNEMGNVNAIDTRDSALRQGSDEISLSMGTTAITSNIIDIIDSDVKEQTQDIKSELENAEDTKVITKTSTLIVSISADNNCSEYDLEKNHSGKDATIDEDVSVEQLKSTDKNELKESCWSNSKEEDYTGSSYGDTLTENGGIIMQTCGKQDCTAVDEASTDFTEFPDEDRPNAFSNSSYANMLTEDDNMLHDQISQGPVDDEKGNSVSDIHSGEDLSVTSVDLKSEEEKQSVINVVNEKLSSEDIDQTVSSECTALSDKKDDQLEDTVIADLSNTNEEKFRKEQEETEALDERVLLISSTTELITAENSQHYLSNVQATEYSLSDLEQEKCFIDESIAKFPLNVTKIEASSLLNEAHCSIETSYEEEEYENNMSPIVEDNYSSTGRLESEQTVDPKDESSDNKVEEDDINHEKLNTDNSVDYSAFLHSAIIEDEQRIENRQESEKENDGTSKVEESYKPAEEDEEKPENSKSELHAKNRLMYDKEVTSVNETAHRKIKNTLDDDFAKETSYEINAERNEENIAKEIHDKITKEFNETSAELFDMTVPMNEENYGTDFLGAKVLHSHPPAQDSDNDIQQKQASFGSDTLNSSDATFSTNESECLISDNQHQKLIHVEKNNCEEKTGMNREEFGTQTFEALFAALSENEEIDDTTTFGTVECKQTDDPPLLLEFQDEKHEESVMINASDSTATVTVNEPHITVVDMQVVPGMLEYATENISEEYIEEPIAVTPAQSASEEVCATVSERSIAERIVDHNSYPSSIRVQGSSESNLADAVDMENYDKSSLELAAFTPTTTNEESDKGPLLSHNKAVNEEQQSNLANVVDTGNSYEHSLESVAFVPTSTNEDSDKGPLLSHNKAVNEEQQKSAESNDCSADNCARYSLKSSLSDKLRTPLLSFVKEEKTYTDTCNKDLFMSASKEKAKQKPRSSFFSSCVCCPAAME